MPTHIWMWPGRARSDSETRFLQNCLMAPGSILTTPQRGEYCMMEKQWEYMAAVEIADRYIIIMI